MGIKGFEDEVKKSDEEIEAQRAIEKHKLEYRKYMQELKDTKGEIETIQKTLETTRNRMQKDFERWQYVMMKEKGMADGGDTQMGDNQSMTDTVVESRQAGGQSTRLGVPQVLTSVDSMGNSQKTAQNSSKVAEDIRDFYKARDDVYKNTSNAKY